MLKNSIISAIFEMRKRQTYSREEILALQDKQFRKLLSHVWDSSSFYREYYQSKGIKRKDLIDISITDLPLTSKELLMEHFDTVVADKRLKKKKLQDWIDTDTDPTKLYMNEYIVVNTSGTSGNIGIFVYDSYAWSTVRASVITRVSKPRFNPLKKNRIAFYGATNGRFGGISLMKNAPRLFYDLKTLSLLSPTSEVIQDLNSFQPDQLSGYSSAIAMLADYQLENKLQISPTKIMVSGDPLTPKMEKLIEKVWSVPVINYYATTEAICIAARLPGDDNLSVFDDTHIVELLSDDMHEVMPGEVGQIVITSLYNKTLPLIRYQIKDLAVKGTLSPNSQFGSIEKIIGRVNDALPITLDHGGLDSLHPVMLNGFFVQNLQKIQFVSHSPSHVQLNYLSTKNIDSDILFEFNKLLAAKGAKGSTKVTLQRVDSLSNDPKTGKFKLVILQK